MCSLTVCDLALAWKPDHDLIDQVWWAEFARSINRVRSRQSLNDLMIWDRTSVYVWCGVVYVETLHGQVLPPPHLFFVKEKIITINK